MTPSWARRAGQARPPYDEAGHADPDEDGENERNERRAWALVLGSLTFR